MSELTDMIAKLRDTAFINNKTYFSVRYVHDLNKILELMAKELKKHDKDIDNLYEIKNHKG